MPVEVDGLEVCVGDTNLVWVGALVELGVDLESGAGGGRADQVDDRLQRDERLPAPVHRDEAEHPVLDFVCATDVEGGSM